MLVMPLNEKSNGEPCFVGWIVRGKWRVEHHGVGVWRRDQLGKEGERLLTHYRSLKYVLLQLKGKTLMEYSVSASF